MLQATTVRDRYRGCLLGGAIGDALGGGIEFLSAAEIRRQHGDAGVTGYVRSYGRLGAITDDTQLTLFTAEALFRASWQPPDQQDVPAALWRAYQRWLITQEAGARSPGQPDGWLIAQDFLHAQRAPGTTCLAALSAGSPGTPGKPVNDSKGCGGVMRVAPVGLAAADPFRLGCEAAALTHGHPSGYLAAGAFALMIGALAKGSDLLGAAGLALDALREAAGGADEVSVALESALRLAASGPSSVASVTSLGEGWVAEEALAMGVYCALTATDFRSGVLAAVNHGGDSDSTGSICGNLLGAVLGAGAIEAGLIGALEGADVIRQVADDLCDVFAQEQPPPAERYPAE